MYMCLICHFLYVIFCISHFSTMPNTPLTDDMDNNDTILNRRSSSGGLLSPEVIKLSIYYI